MSKDRLEVFSDGVFSIVLTLLIFGLNTPQVADHSSLGQYAKAMASLIPKFVSFVLSFVMISIYWVSHHYFFRLYGQALSRAKTKKTQPYIAAEIRIVCREVW